MRLKHSSYQIFFTFLVCIVLLISVRTNAAEIFLDPDITFLTGSIGEEFQLELKVDETTLGMRLFQVFIKFESSLLDTVSSSLGPLFDNSGFSTFYNMKLVYDSTTSDSLLKIEGLLLGPSSVVDGPGTVAILTFKTAGIGVADLSIINHTITDISNDTIPSTSVGALAYINTPPASFNTILPTVGETVSKFPGESIQLTWESSSSVYPGENIVYELQYSPDNGFPSGNTNTVTALTGTMYSLPADSLENGFVFWKVRAIGDIYAFEQTSSQNPSFFDFAFATVEPNAFNIISPVNGRLENLNGDVDILFDWEDALPGSPGDIIEYTFYIGETQTFPSTPLIEIQTGTNSEVMVASSTLPYCQQVYWTVEAINQHGLFTWANSINSVTFIRRGDVNCSGGSAPIDISDIVFFVSFMFGGGVAPEFMESGNVNCSTDIPIIDISDLVFIINFAFSGGPSPDCDL